MARFKMFILLLTLLLVLSSCNKVKSEGFDAFCGAFACEYSYVDGDKLYRVRLLAGEMDDEGGRSATLSFIEPETLEGLECRLSGGECRVTCGDVAIAGESAKAFLLSAEPLLFGGRAQFCEVSELGGIRCERFVMMIDGIEASIYVDGRTELPIAVTSMQMGKEATLNIISFERNGKQ